MERLTLLLRSLSAKLMPELPACRVVQPVVSLPRPLRQFSHRLPLLFVRRGMLNQYTYDTYVEHVSSANAVGHTPRKSVAISVPFVPQLQYCCSIKNDWVAGDSDLLKHVDMILRKRTNPS